MSRPADDPPPTPLPPLTRAEVARLVALCKQSGPATKAQMRAADDWATEAVITLYAEESR